MKVKQEPGILLWRLIQLGIIVLTVVGYIKGIFISLDIDESYALAQSYRLAIGEHLFVDLWESHQLSAFLGAFFIKVYLLLFQTTDYLVIYLRVVGMLIHVGLGAWLYRSLTRSLDKSISFLILFLHLNFFPKWVQMPEFELMHYWFFLAIFLLLYRYFEWEKSSWWQPALAGAFLVGSMMCYPTMILVYPVYLVGLCVLEWQKHAAKGAKMLRSSLWFTTGAGIAGVAFLGYLFSYQSIEEFLKNVSYIFMDESHTTYTMAQKWGFYAGQAKELCQLYLKYLLLAAAIVMGFGLVVVLLYLVKKKSVKVLVSWKTAELAVLAAMLLTALGLQAKHILGCLILDENQFYMQVRYVAVIIPVLYLAIRYHKKMSVYFYLCVLPALAALPAALMITNMNVNVTFSRVVLGTLGSLLMLYVYWQDELQEQAERVLAIAEKVLIYFLGLGLLAGFFVCRLIMIRVTGCLPVTVMAPLEQMEYGPEKGVYILEEQARIWNDNYSILENVIDKEDRLLYIGAENLIYPAMECTLSTPSTQGTTVFNEMFLRYYEEHPEKLPSIIVVDKTFGTNPVYGLFSNSQVILDWIEENYKDARGQETTYMKILYLEE